MKYNCTIENEGALPIPYSIVIGKDNVSVRSLYKDKPLFIQLNYITGSNDGTCIRFNCVWVDAPCVLIVQVNPSLLIKFVPEAAKSA